MSETEWLALVPGDVMPFLTPHLLVSGNISRIFPVYS
jgi:hypothetical protein